MAKKQPISRRDFIKGMAAGAASVVTLGVLQACESGISSSADSSASSSGSTAATVTATPADGATYVPGTYTGTATGIGTVTVTMTFDENSITDVQVDVSEETETIGGLYGEDLAEMFMEAQSADIDTISSATVTSTAAIKAAQSCIAQAKGEAAATASTASSDYEVPSELTAEEVEASSCELGDITPDETVDMDVVVVGAGAAGVVAAGVAAEEGVSVALLQKEASVVSQGNCASAIIKSKSTDAGIAKWIHHTNALDDWRADTNLLRAYADNSEDALMWYLNRAGLTSETEYGDGTKVDDNDNCAELLNDGNGLYAYMSTSEDLTGVWSDRLDSYDYGDDHCYFMAPWIGPKPYNVGNVLQNVLDNVAAANSNLDVHYSTPAVKLVMDGEKVTGVIGKDADGKYIQFNASKGVILATGDYMNNDAMVARWCPDTLDFDKKQYHKTGDGHILALSAGGKMEPLGHTKMMHDFDSGLMYEEPFLYVNMDGERFTNEYTGFVYMGNLLKFQRRYSGDNMTVSNENGSKGWYCTIYDSDYENWPEDEFVSGMVPAAAMQKYIPGAVEDPEGVYDYLIDSHCCDTLEELAEELDIPYDTLKETVDRYNELCEDGNDVDFGKPAKYMHPIKTAPFWGVRKHIRVSALCSGVMINANGQALNADGEVIEGLYCIGNLGGPFYGGNDYPFHQTGLSIGRCYTFGYIAGKHAASN
ncbi:MAG: FAD-binding protein [Clostridiales bacterium]|nr:FAD-binding protein [Clostridiales bacterium]